MYQRLVYTAYVEFLSPSTDSETVLGAVRTLFYLLTASISYKVMVIT